MSNSWILTPDQLIDAKLRNHRGALKTLDPETNENHSNQRPQANTHAHLRAHTQTATFTETSGQVIFEGSP